MPVHAIHVLTAGTTQRSFFVHAHMASAEPATGLRPGSGVPAAYVREREPSATEIPVVTAGAATTVDGDGGRISVTKSAPRSPRASPDRRLREAERRLFERYELAVESRTLDLEPLGIRTRVLSTGAGPPALLVHGGSGTPALWAPLMAELRGFRVHAVDRPGAGIGRAFDYTGVDLRAHAVAFVESVLDGLGLERVPLVANSMGGLWSFWFAADRPGRVAGLVQMGCPALVFGTRAPPAMRLLSLGPPRPGDPAEQARAMLRFALGHRGARGLPEEFLECLHAGERRPAHIATRASLLAELAATQARVPNMGLGPEALAAMTRPVLFVWGEDDWYGASEIGRRACRMLPNASLEVVPGGHLPWLQKPARCGALVSAAFGRALAGHDSAR